MRNPAFLPKKQVAAKRLDAAIHVHHLKKAAKVRTIFANPYGFELICKRNG